MHVQWWTSCVAYLPHASISLSQQRAIIAGRAWAHVHARPLDTDSDGEEVPDLWEQRYHGGMRLPETKEDVRLLPDWGCVEDGGEEVVIPPFFTAEVEALPRGADVELHAHLGVVGGVVRVC
jgi:diphthine-ammonia ligase